MAAKIMTLCTACHEIWPMLILQVMYAPAANVLYSMENDMIPRPCLLGLSQVDS